MGLLRGTHEQRTECCDKFESSGGDNKKVNDPHFEILLSSGIHQSKPVSAALILAASQLATCTTVCAPTMVAVLVTPVSLISAPRAATRSLRSGAAPGRVARSAVAVRAVAEERQVGECQRLIVRRPCRILRPSLELL